MSLNSSYRCGLLQESIVPIGKNNDANHQRPEYVFT